MLKQLAVILIIKLAAIAILFALVAIIGMLCLGGMALTIFLVDTYIATLDPGTVGGFMGIFLSAVPFFYMLGHSWKILERYAWFHRVNDMLTFSVTDYLRRRPG